MELMQQGQKDFDFKNNVFKLQAKHDWTSHGADAFRYLAVSYRNDFGNANTRRNDFAEDKVINF
jgi:hypothetical protein